MADVRYYVSQQHGNDANDGLTPLTAWRSITVASQNVPKPNDGDTIYVHIGPGTYREKVIPLNGGFSASSLIIYQGDPFAIYNTNDIPGRVRITGCNNEDTPTTGSVLDWSSVSNVELQHVYVDGSSDNYACYRVPVCRYVHATGHNGFYIDANEHALHYCTAVVKNIGMHLYRYGNVYECSAIAGNYAFCSSLYNVDSDYHFGQPDLNQFKPSLHRCFGIGGVAAFRTHISGSYDVTGYLEAKACHFNCVAYGSASGFLTHDALSTSSTKNINHDSSSYTATNNSQGNYYDCVAVACSTGFASGGTGWGKYYIVTFNCIALACNVGFVENTKTSSAAHYNPSGVLTSTSAASIKKMIGLELAKLVPPFIKYTGDMPKFGIVHNFNYISTSAVNLSVERLIPFTPPAGKSIGVQLRFSSVGSSGSVLVELQKYVVDTWITQRYKSISVDDISLSNGGFNSFIWDSSSGTGDDNLTAEASTWRYRVTATDSAVDSVVTGISATVPTTIGLYVPANFEDVNGSRIHGLTAIGAKNEPDALLDLAVYNTNAPSIKIVGAGEKVFKLPVTKDVETTVTYQVRHDGAEVGREPQIAMRHPDMVEITDTHADVANTWDLLSITFTPIIDGEVDIAIINRDQKKNAWFSDPIVI